MNELINGKIQDCIILAGPDLEPTECAVFEYEDGIITRMDLGKPAPTPIGTKQVVIPGLVNAHTHVGDAFLADAATQMTLAEAFFRPDGFKYRALKQIEPDEHIAHMTDFLCGMANSGVVAHFDFREQGIKGCRRLREASKKSGVRSVILSQLDQSPFSEDELSNPNLPLPESVQKEAEELFTLSDGFSESTMNDLTDRAWAQIAEMTEAAGKARAVHCLEDNSYRDTSLKRTGKGDLARAIDLLDPDIIIHLTVANHNEIKLLAESKIPAVINPRANAVLGLPMPPVARLLRAGVPLLLGTDNGMLNGPNLFAELDFTYKLARSQAGPEDPIQPLDILRMVTSNVQKTRWGDELPGYLAEGLPATFAVIDFFSPCLATSRHLHSTLLTRITPANIQQTVLAGQTIHSKADSA